MFQAVVIAFGWIEVSVHKRHGVMPVYAQNCPFKGDNSSR